MEHNGWDWPWLFACLTHHGLSILPSTNLISNIGFDETATHTKNADDERANVPTEAMSFPLRHPPYMVRDTEVERRIFAQVGWQPEPEDLYHRLRRKSVDALPPSLRRPLASFRSRLTSSRQNVREKANDSPRDLGSDSCCLRGFTRHPGFYDRRRAAAGGPRFARGADGRSVLRGIESNVRQVADQLRRPSIDIAFSNHATQVTHAVVPLVRGHLESRADAFRELFDVVRVHDERIVQLGRRAGELAQDQHAVLILARRDELLRDQIHPVVQRSDQAEIGGLVQLLDVVVTVVLGEQQNRLPSAALKLPVDSLGFRFHFEQQILVAFDLRPARRADLHEGETFPVGRMLLEQTFDGSKPFDDAFRVVDPVDAHAEELAEGPDVSADRRPLLFPQARRSLSRLSSGQRRR